MNIDKINFLEIQPSQFYISEKKIEDINKWFNPNDLSNFEAIPVKELNGKIIFTDGHTRAYVAYKAGIKNIPLYLENEELSWDVYQICVDECNIRGVFSIKDLDNKVLNQNDYKTLWNEWCDDLHCKSGE